jgi:hypothetical protein
VLPDKERKARADEVRAFAAVVAKARRLPCLREAGARALSLEVHLRGLTADDLRVLAEHVRAHAHGWRRHRPNGEDRSVIDPEDVDLYDINLNFLVPLAVLYGISFAELMSRGRPAVAPAVFVSHAWTHPFLQTCEVLGQHAEDRELGADETAWICADALRQHAPGGEIPADIEQAPFVKAIRAARMTLVIVSSKNYGVLYRSWCGLEAFMCMVLAGAEFKTDIYTYHEGKVHGFTDGFIRRDIAKADFKAEGRPPSRCTWCRMRSSSQWATRRRACR